MSEIAGTNQVFLNMFRMKPSSRSLFHIGIAVLGPLLLIGCNSRASNDYDATVQGAVTVDGELAKGGTVSFYPVEKGPAAVSPIRSDGSYALRIGQGNRKDPDLSKIPSGEYTATVIVTGPSDENATSEGGPRPLGPLLVADKYSTRETSDLKLKVKSGRNVIALKLDGTWSNPPQEKRDQPADVENNAADIAMDSADSAAESLTANEEATPAVTDDASPVQAGRIPADATQTTGASE